VRVFKTKRLDRWAGKEGLADKVLWQAALEVAAGNVEASLGQCLYKKRLARPGEGKRSGLRTIVAFKSASGDRIFFVYGFAKNQQANITETERLGPRCQAFSRRHASRDRQPPARRRTRRGHQGDRP